MRINEVKTVGKRKYTFSGEGNNVFEALIDLGKASFGDVFGCGLCKSDNLILEAHYAGDDNFEYSSVRCLDCKASLTLGKRKKGEMMYLRRKEDGKYDWKEFVAK